MKDIKFECSSILDDCGVIFYFEGKVFRAIRKSSVRYVKNILELSDIDILFKVGLINTKISKIKLEGFPIVLEHRRIPFISHCSEWVSEMLKDSLIMVCNLSIELAKKGYILIDIHPGNILFEKYKPIFIDFGAIRPIKGNTEIPYSGIRDFFIIPLWFKYKGFNILSDYAMKEYPNGLEGHSLLRYLSNKRFIKFLPFGYRHILERYFKQKIVNKQQSVIDYYKELKQYAQNFKLKNRKEVWLEYPQPLYKNGNTINDNLSYSKKAKAIKNFLEELPKGTLLDIACNKGEYSRLAADLGYKVVAFDYEEGVTTKIYKRNKYEKKDILALKINFLYPVPACNIGLCVKSSIERLRCDTTIVLAIIHHLVFGQNAEFRTISRIINQYTIKNSIVEFIPSNDEYVSNWITSRHEWYTIENFINEMMKYFNEYKIVGSSPEPRKLILFKK